jgi:hypothetical protein
MTACRAHVLSAAAAARIRAGRRRRGRRALLDDARGVPGLSGSSRSSSAPCTDAVRAVLSTSHGLPRAAPARPALSRTFVRGLATPAFVHRAGLVRNFDVQALIRGRLARPRALDAGLRRRAIDAACAMLSALGRETDAIALAYPGGVEWHDVGRGIAVALYAMRPDRREALDSHIGMMLFKNGLPVAYGGGWPFAGTCRIGVNIFEPYRGGESALLFAQVLHVYHRRFRITRFVVEPSQFGGTNTEGLRSGAFWFAGHRLAGRSTHCASRHARQRSTPA